MLAHILPNIVAPVIVLASVLFGNAIIIEASLSFLGLGTPPPTPSWGGMLSGAGRQFMERVPTLALFPGLAISIAVLAFNLLGICYGISWTPDYAVDRRDPEGMGFPSVKIIFRESFLMPVLTQPVTYRRTRSD